MNLLLADDHTIMRQAVKALLADDETIRVIAEASSGDEVIRLIDELQVDVILMDLDMPEKDGLETTKYVTEKHPEIKILMFSMINNDRYISKVIEAGANGYLLKCAGQDELVNAIKLVAKGQQYISPEISLNLLKNVNSVGSKHTHLKEGSFNDISKREMEVLQLISEGFTNYEIAEKLFTSKRTIESHRKNLLEKTEVKNTAALIKYAIVNNIIKT